MKQARPAADWDRYWRGTWEAAAHEDGSPQDSALEAFWHSCLAGLANGTEAIRLLDVAAGNGAVIRHAGAVAGAIECYALDYSVSALYNLRERYSSVRCVAADALRPGLAPGSFDAVVSQYGIEYAGIEAVSAAAALVRPGGLLALVLHCHDGAIYRECANNQRVLLEIIALDVLELARGAFQAGFALNAGRGSAADFKTAERRFVPAVRGLEKMLQREGREVAGGLLQQLYGDIAAMYKRMSAYAEEDVMGWIDGMGLELDAYVGRMRSMVAAAVTREQLEQQAEGLQRAGFSRPATGELRIRDGARPAAWTLLARREAATAAAQT